MTHYESIRAKYSSDEHLAQALFAQRVEIRQAANNVVEAAKHAVSAMRTEMEGLQAELCIAKASVKPKPKRRPGDKSTFIGRFIRACRNNGEYEDEQ